MEITNDLNGNQWSLANFLEDTFAEDPTKVVTKEMIVNNFPKTYKRDEEMKHGISNHNSCAYAQIRRDIRAIRNSKLWFHIIITKNNGYKIATQKEAEEYIKRILQSTIKKLSMISNLSKHYKNDGQTRLTFDTKMKELINTFME